jgi:hypothetical protein
MKIRLAHASLQFSDNDKQHTADIEKLFGRAVDLRYAWITGTEAGPGAGNTGSELLRVGKAAGYRMWVPEVQGKGVARHTDSWIAVRENLITGNWKRGYDNVIPGSAQLEDELPEPLKGKRWGPKGLVHVSFDSLPRIGHVSVGAAHYLTDARRPSSQYWEWNEKLGRHVTAWAREVGKGKALAFYGGDQNMADSKNNEPQGDTFFGGPVTSIADELKTWQNTGHGPIDVIASYDGDGRVKPLRWNVLDDKEFFLHTDHFLCEAVYEVKELKAA